jgi:hypothetical protein
MSTALALVSTASSFATAPADAWFATYDPKDCGSLVLHFKHELGQNTEVLEVCQARKQETGAQWYTVNGKPHTLENIRAMEPFTVVLSTYHVGPGYGYWVKGQENINPLEGLFEALGDTASAERLRDTFPRIFAPPAMINPRPVSLPVPQPRKRWYWPF